MPKKKLYDVKYIEDAINDIKGNKMSLRAAEKKYGIPKSTLEFKLKNPGHKDTCGPSPILTVREEFELVEWIQQLSERGFPRKKEDIFNSVQLFLKENPRPNPFKNDRPGESWLKAFLKRHPTVVQRTSEAVSAASACVSETNIRKWFQEIENYLASKNIDINDASRVYNGDETGFQICPGTGKVFAAKGMKNVYTIDKGSQKENITVMFSFSASGLSCPPMVIYAYKRIPEKISGTVNASWGIGRSDNGWMTSDTFYEYIKHIFYPHLVENNIVFPVILFLDGHKSHLTYELSRLCNELNIELIALYPNATRILQPCDVAVFRPIKIGWKKAVREFYANHPGQVLNKISFAPLLEKVVTEVVKPKTLVNGFRACGLFPFNPDAIDFSKCLGKDDKPAEATHPSSVTMDYKTFLNFIGGDLTRKFKSLDVILNNHEFNSEFVTLYKMWNFFKKDEKLDEDVNNNPQQVEVVRFENPELVITPDKNTENPEFVDELAIESEQNIDSEVNANPATEATKSKEINIISNVLLKPADTTTVFTHLPQVLSLPSTSKSFSTYLEVPDPPQRKNKRDTERIPFAITSRVYQEMYEKKRELKLEEEKKKLERKRKREAAAEAKTNSNNKKVCKSKLQVIANNCFVCKRHPTIKSNYLTCDTCKNYFHRRCIPNIHKQHVPDVEDDDPFMCHICYKEESEGDGDESVESVGYSDEWEKNEKDEKEEREDSEKGDENKKIVEVTKFVQKNEEREDNAKSDENKERGDEAKIIQENEERKDDATDDENKKRGDEAKIVQENEKKEDDAKGDENKERGGDGKIIQENEEREDDAKGDENEQLDLIDLYNMYKRESAKYYY